MRNRVFHFLCFLFPLFHFDGISWNFYLIFFYTFAIYFH